MCKLQLFDCWISPQVLWIKKKNSGSIPKHSAKHSYEWLPRKCDYRTDRHTEIQTDAGQNVPYGRYASHATQKRMVRYKSSTYMWLVGVILFTQRSRKFANQEGIPDKPIRQASFPEFLQTFSFPFYTLTWRQASDLIKAITWISTHLNSKSVWFTYLWALVRLSRRLRIVITGCPSSVRPSSIVRRISFFYITFYTSSLKQLNRMKWILTGHKISTSSTIFLYFRSDMKTKMAFLASDLLRHLRFSETAERNPTKFARKQDLNTLCQVCAVAYQKSEMVRLADWLRHFRLLL